MDARFVSSLASMLVFATALFAGPRDAQWREVEEARKNGLPKTAVAALEPIIAGALADRAYPEAIKALGQKIAFEGEIHGDKPQEQITRMLAALETAPAGMKPMMQALVARWYWHYFQQNRGRFLQRTRTAEGAVGDDFETWDLPRILTEIDRRFTTALTEGEAMLKATPVAAYDALLEPGTLADAYRPTLFDFIAHEALQFYQTGEQSAVTAADAFELEADGPAFADAATFAAWNPAASPDDTSPKLKAIRLYQQLLHFHAADTDRTAFLDVDLARLAYAHNVAVGETEAERYKAALARFIAATARHEIFARACALLATQLHTEEEPARAHALATRGFEKFPESMGGTMCFNLIKEIEAKEVQIVTEHVWTAPWPTVDVMYRNVRHVYFRAVAADFEDMIQGRLSGPRDPESMEFLRAASPALAWDAALPPTQDFKTRVEKIPVPTTLKPGFYFVFSSHDPNFAETENRLQVTPVWVSDLALVTQQDHRANAARGFVLHAQSGEPIAGATVNLWREKRGGDFDQEQSALTDADGRYAFSTGGNRANSGSFMVSAEHRGQQVASHGEFRFWRLPMDAAEKKTVFFTDRAIYRPGQTIYYKGLALTSDTSRGKYAVLADREVTVVFKDPNDKEIARATHRTNDYGSFSGTFTAPRDRLTGSMSLETEGTAAEGEASFQVEEYKRPKFQVELQAPVEAAKLGAAVALTGKATAYTGAPIGGAKVQWSVQREARFPSWCWWARSSAKALAHGVATTEPDGTFKVQFIAEPDRAVPQKWQPIFNYRVNADVTDTTGETRSDALVVRAGYTALEASILADAWQTPDKPVKFTVTARSLDGVGQSVEGSLVIYELRQPAKVERASLAGRLGYGGRQKTKEPHSDPGDPESWEQAKAVARHAFKTDTKGEAIVSASLPAGIYRAVVETKDRFGKSVTARHTVQVVDPLARRYGVKLASHLAASKWTVEPGEKFTALWGTGYESGRAFVELECAGKTLRSTWTDPKSTQAPIELPITEAMRGGLTLRVTFVRENRAYLSEQVIPVPWSNKEFAVKWETFRSKLLPGQKETWTAVITGSDGKPAAAEMVAALYNASLDQFSPHHWRAGFGIFRNEYSLMRVEFQNDLRAFGYVGGDWTVESLSDEDWRYRSFPRDTTATHWGWAYLGDEEMIELSPFTVENTTQGWKAAHTLAGSRLSGPLAASYSAAEEVLADTAGLVIPSPSLDTITARKNLQETAFFFPHLIAGDDGVVKLQFTMPEALTTWRFLGFAHDASLRAGLLTDQVVTAKDIMVEPNPPRFVREGDALEFTVKVSNRTDAPQQGKVRLTFSDAATQQSVDAALGNAATEQAFDLRAGEARSFAWRIAVPDGLGFVTYKAVGATARASDGEEGFLPVLSRRVLVTESLPLPIRGPATKEFSFTKLLESARSDTLRHQALTVQMVSQPAWYAVMALPYLMEFPHACSEQLFNRLYANALARHIANSDPKIRRVFDLWKNTTALESPLEKNQDLKSVMIEETPWLREAADESTARRNVGLLFDANRLDGESAATLAALAERQLGDGLWSWFPGGRASEYISLYVATGFGRLRHLGVTVDVAPALKALDGLDAWMARRHREILRGPKPEEYVPNSLDALYLYGRSFFLKDRPVAAEHRAAVDFFLQQARRFWLKVDSRQSQAHLALALQRSGDADTPPAIVKSLKERSVSSEELGMFWRDCEAGWWWHRAPIETQAMMIEVFAEVARDVQAVEDCKVWLLKQKQTQNWKTTKATADAIYALLLVGENLLASDARVEVALGGETIRPATVEAGTGFYEKKFVRAEVTPAMGRVTVTKTDTGVTWGGVHWQYLEDLGKIAPHEGTPLKFKKTLFVKETTAKGPVLKPVTGPVAVGDELVVRLELRADRDLEFVHLKDQRGSGTEPVNVISGYRFQDGLAYYESTRDTASHFFIDYLRKGAHVFEYSTRVQLRGSYQTGVAEIQCMYAPEFNSHSQAVTLEVR
jgi:uncharacterized protein YfaS (alpha-2-macroglobulin family)